jgi:hypothetical protein
MKKSDVFSKIRIMAGETFYRFCPKTFLNVGTHFFRFFRDIFYRSIISDEEIINIGQKNKHVFFGYYDITPFSNNDKLLLAMQAPLISRAPEMKDEAEIGFYHLDFPENGFTVLGKTNTWCWQQGCRLQWYSNGNNKIIYNCIVNGEYGAVIKEVSSGIVVKKIKKPLYSVSCDGKWGLTLDFSRLQRLRLGYGYGALPDKTKKEFLPVKSGIELVNLITDDVSFLFSVEKISQIEPHDSMDGAEHYFNHLMFNPIGNKFLFFHLWVKSGKRHSRMFVANRDGKNIKLLNNSGSVSHYNWISNDEIMLYSFIKEKNKYMYAIFDSLNGKTNFFGKSVPKKDGHPTLLKNGEIFITDTYPDLLSQRKVLSYNVRKDHVEVLTRIDDFRDFAGEFRCDLHPRISNGEKMVCIDRIINNRRHMTIIPIDTNKL